MEKKREKKRTGNSPQLEFLKFAKYEVPSQPGITDISSSLKSSKTPQAG